MRMPRRESGISTLQVLISATIFAFVLMATVAYSMTIAQRFGGLRDSASAASVASGVISRLERELYQAELLMPSAWLVAEATSGDATIVVDRVVGLPPQGSVLLRGAGGTVAARYTAIAAGFDGWDLSLADSLSAILPIGTPVRWGDGGALDATVTVLDTGSFGQSIELTGVREFLGAGSSVSFRRRILGGSASGAVILGNEVVDGTSALGFVAVSTLNEADVLQDLNRDGDQLDVFDVGQIRRQNWSPHGSGGAVDRVAVSPTAVLQERGAWGSDLDGDGDDDPIFLADPESGRLRIRVFLRSGAGREARVTRFETTVRMRVTP